MAGTFEITKNLSDEVKFRGNVSFNGKQAEYYEVDFPEDFVDLSAGAFINNQLQEAADADLERSNVIPVELEIEGGKLVE